MRKNDRKRLAKQRPDFKRVQSESKAPKPLNYHQQRQQKFRHRLRITGCKTSLELKNYLKSNPDPLSLPTDKQLDLQQKLNPAQQLMSVTTKPPSLLQLQLPEQQPHNNNNTNNNNAKSSQQQQQQQKHGFSRHKRHMIRQAQHLKVARLNQQRENERKARWAKVNETKHLEWQWKFGRISYEEYCNRQYIPQNHIYDPDIEVIDSTPISSSYRLTRIYIPKQKMLSTQLLLQLPFDDPRHIAQPLTPQHTTSSKHNKSSNTNSRPLEIPTTTFKRLSTSKQPEFFNLNKAETVHEEDEVELMAEDCDGYYELMADIL